ncbi:MAG TPA: hypothetical protein VNV86_15325 [Candidatus Acidoferrum sp.]|nr:hypothetical protein [Candidatus Acidoferrum sp.]
MHKPIFVKTISKVPLVDDMRAKPLFEKMPQLRDMDGAGSPVWNMDLRQVKTYFLAPMNACDHSLISHRQA